MATNRIAAIAVPQTTQKVKLVRKACRTRSVRPAPPFWPVTGPMEADSAKSGTRPKASTRAPTPIPATAASPNCAMPRPDITMVRAKGLKVLDAAAGAPTRAISPQLWKSSSKPCQWKSISFSRKTRYHEISRKVTPLAATVASAAPDTPHPSPGRPNTSSRIKKGSRTRFTTAAPIIITEGSTALPSARRMLLATIGPTIKTIPANQTVM